MGKSAVEIVKGLREVLLGATEDEVNEVSLEETQEEVQEAVQAAPSPEFVTQEELASVKSELAQAVAELTAVIEQMKDIKEDKGEVPVGLSAVEEVAEVAQEEVQEEVQEAVQEANVEVEEEEVIHSPEAVTVEKRKPKHISSSGNQKDAIYDYLWG